MRQYQGESIKPEKWFYKIMPAMIIMILLLNIFIMFTSKYNIADAEIPMLIHANEQLNRLVFCGLFIYPSLYTTTPCWDISSLPAFLCTVYALT
jgi:hypothetical protein